MVKGFAGALAFAVLLITTSASAATVGGSVVSGTGDSLSSVIVTFSPIAGGGTAFADTTDSHSRYSIANVTQGFYTVTAVLSGYAMATTTDFANVGNTALTHNIIMNALTVGSKLAGSVTDSVTGLPLPGAKVYLQQINVTIDSAITDVNGKYLIDSLQTGTYAVRATATDYTAKTTVLTATGTGVDSLKFALKPILYGRITGKISVDSLTGSALPGVQVILVRRTAGGGGGTRTVVDTVSTSANGIYSFLRVAAGNYEITGALTGFTSRMVRDTITATETDSVNFALATAQFGKISGTVRGDSLNGVLLSSVKVVLALRINGGMQTPVDSVVTTASGVFSFASVATGVYNLVFSSAGYISKTVRDTITATESDTLRAFLAHTPKGNIYAVVKKAADSTAISGADVSISLNGIITPATTASTGRASFVNIDAGTYAITASANGFSTQTRGNRVIAEGTRDTVVFYLVIPQTSTKVLRGIVRDSVSNLPLANALVIFSSGNAQTTTLFDSTDATGTYVITGIASTVATGSLSAQAAGHLSFSRNFMVLTSDTTTQNIALLVVPSGVVHEAQVYPKAGQTVLIQNGSLIVSGFEAGSTVTLYALNGAVIYKTVIAQDRKIAVSTAMLPKVGAFVARVSGLDKMFCKMVFVK